MELWVTKSGQAVWRAHGFFNSNRVETTGDSISAAAAVWKMQDTLGGHTSSFKLPLT